VNAGEAKSKETLDLDEKTPLQKAEICSVKWGKRHVDMVKHIILRIKSVM